MRDIRAFLTIWAGLIATFLVLEHYTGFSADVHAVGSSLTGLTKTMQGR